jgi:hypothetical protein
LNSLFVAPCFAFVGLLSSEIAGFRLLRSKSREESERIRHLIRLLNLVGRGKGTRSDKLIQMGDRGQMERPLMSANSLAQQHQDPSAPPLAAEQIYANHANDHSIPVAVPVDHVYMQQPVNPPTIQIMSTSRTAQGLIPRGDQGGYSQMPRRIICQYCGYEVVTRVDTRATTGTHCMALLLCFFGLWPCCIFPYCIDDCQGTVHICPNCHREVGHRRTM